MRHGLQQLIELEVAAVLGAEPHERTDERLGYRNGSRPRLLTTQVGDVPLSIPKLRSGSFFPTFLEPRRRIDQALYAVIMEAWVKGISTRKVDALVAAISGLKQRGLTGVRLVVSDAHVGLTKAVSRMFQGSSWQRCCVHFARNLLQNVPIGEAFSEGVAQQEMVAAALRSVFAQQGRSALEEQWDQVAAMLTAKFPKAAELMASAREDVLAFRHFPQQHWRKLWSTNLLERLNEEIKRRTRVVGIFPNDAAITRLGAVLLEQDEHW